MKIKKLLIMTYIILYVKKNECPPKYDYVILQLIPTVPSYGSFLQMSKKSRKNTNNCVKISRKDQKHPSNRNVGALSLLKLKDNM